VVSHGATAGVIAADQAAEPGQDEAGVEPVFNPSPKVSRELKFGAESGARHEFSLDESS